MAESPRPPQQEVPPTLSHWISGGRLRTTPAPSGPGRPLNTVVPHYLIPEDRSQVIGEALAGNTIGHFEIFVTAALSGRQPVHYFGKEDRVLEMNYTFLQEAADEWVREKFGGPVGTSGQVLLNTIGLGTRQEFDKQFKAWLTTDQIKKREENFWSPYSVSKYDPSLYKYVPKWEARVARWYTREGVLQGRPPSVGLGQYTSPPPGYALTHPTDVLTGLARQRLNIGIESVVRSLTVDQPRFNDISALTRGTQQRYVDAFITQHLQGLINDPAKLNFLHGAGLVYQDTNGQWKIVGDFRDYLAKKYIEPSTLIRAYGHASRLYSTYGKEVKKATDNPAQWFALAIPRLVWSRLLRKVVMAQLEKILPKSLYKELYILTKGGLNKIPTNLSRRLGELVWKFWRTAWKQAVKDTKPLASPAAKAAARAVREGLKRAASETAKAARKGLSRLFSQVLKGLIETVGAALGAAVEVLLDVGIGTVGVFVAIVVAILALLVIVVAIFYFALTAAAPQNTGGCSISGNVAKMNSSQLLNYVNGIGNQLCVPPALMLAEMQREAPGSFNWTDAQYTHYSTEDWWVGNNDTADLRTGYCYDNGSGVFGITQFTLGTFNGYSARVAQITGHAANRCNAQDAIVAMALKLKADSGTDSKTCTNWDQATVFKVAGSYCGNQCVDQENVCGVDYCGGVYQFYQGYQAGLVCTGGGIGGPGHPNIVAADEALDACSYYPDGCGFMVQKALQIAGYRFMVSANGSADGFLNSGSSSAINIGYDVFTLPGAPHLVQYNAPDQLPQPGDVVVWTGGLNGHTGIVTDVKIVNGQTIVYVHSNLDCPSGTTYTGNRDTAFVVQGGNLRSSQLNASVYQVLGFARVTNKVKL
jgi:CHAP domain